MRIAFLVADFPKLSETFILNQVTGLIDRGHQVDIYTDYVGDWSLVHPDVNRYGLRQHTYQMQYVPINYLWRFLKGIWLVLRYFLQAPRLIGRSLNAFAYGKQAAGLSMLYAAVSLVKRKPRYDIIHCQFGTQGYRGLAFKRLLQSEPKLVVMFRGHDISRHVKQKGDKFYEKLFEYADYCLANCEFFRQRVIDLGCDPEKVSVHFSGLDANKFKFCERHLHPGDSVQIATTGRLVEKKGIEYAIRAIARQAKRFPGLTYYIIGDGVLRQPLEALVNELKAASFIHFLGWKNESEIIEILDASHLFIAPSVTALDGNQDAPTNVLKEAMVMGLPVLSTDHGGIPELVQDDVSGFLVPERDVEALSTKLGDLLAHPERWPDMGRAGHLFVKQHFDLAKLNDRLARLYEKLHRGNDDLTASKNCRPGEVLAAIGEQYSRT
ncbi:MAG: glycosyltransferase [Cyanobacteria bacterium J06642_2]